MATEMNLHRVPERQLSGRLFCYQRQPQSLDDGASINCSINTTERRPKVSRGKSTRCSLLSIVSIVFTTTTLTILSCIAPMQTYAALPNDVVAPLKKMKIYPDMLSSLPDQVVSLQINSKQVKAGEFVAAKDLKLIPSRVAWGQSNNDAESTIIMLDVDRHHMTPNNSINSYNMWTQINVRGESLASGWPMMSYNEPYLSGCSAGSSHRILVLVYHQIQNIDIKSVLDLLDSSSRNNKAREDFRLNEFVNQHGLTLQAITAFHAQGPGMCSSSSHLTSSWLSAIASIVFMLLLRQSVHR